MRPGRHLLSETPTKVYNSIEKWGKSWRQKPLPNFAYRYRDLKWEELFFSFSKHWRPLKTLLLPFSALATSADVDQLLLILCLIHSAHKNQPRLSHFYPTFPNSLPPTASNRAPKTIRTWTLWKLRRMLQTFQYMWAASPTSQVSAAKSWGKEWHFHIVTFCTTGSESREDKEMSGDFYSSALAIIEQESCMSRSWRPTYTTCKSSQGWSWVFHAF